MSTKTIGQLEDSNQLDGNDFIAVYNAEPGSDHVTYKARINNVLGLKSISVNGKTGNTITLNADDIADTVTTKKFVSAAEKSKIGIIKTDQGTSTYLAGDGTYKTIDLSYSGQSFITSGQNIGGVGLFSSKFGNTLQFKGLVAGTNITLTTSTTGITISSGDADGDFITETEFNVYTGATQTAFNAKLNTSAFNVYSASTQTAINLKLSSGAFNSYTASTQTALNLKLNATNFNNFTGTTAPTTYLGKSAFNIYSGLTDTRIYNLELNTGSTVTSSNGLTKVDNDILLGGSLTQDTIFTGANTHNLFIGQAGGEEIASLNIATSGGYNEWNAGEGIITMYSASNYEGSFSALNIAPGYLEMYGGGGSLTTSTFSIGSSINLASGGGAIISSNNNYVQLIQYDTGGNGNTSITLTSGSTIVVDAQSSSFAGIQYAQDFTANFTDSSLINKGYVDIVINDALTPYTASTVVRAIKADVPNYSYTTTTTEEGTRGILIPANTVGVGDIVQIKILNQKTGTNGSCTHRVRIHTINSLAGSTLLGTWNNAASTAAHTIKAQREIFVISSTQTLPGIATATDAATDDGVNATPSTVNIDWTVNQYIITSSQLASGSDTAKLVSYYVNVIKKAV